MRCCPHSLASKQLWRSCARATSGSLGAVVAVGLTAAAAWTYRPWFQWCPIYGWVGERAVPAAPEERRL